MLHAATSRGQATVEGVGLWALVALAVLAAGAVAARGLVVPAPQPDAIERVAEPLALPAPELRHAGRPGVRSSTHWLRDYARYRASLDRAFAAGVADRLRTRGREAIEDPEAVLRLLLTNGSAPAGAADIAGEAVRDLRRIARLEPGDAGRAAARDAGELTADLLLARALRAAGRRVRGRSGEGAGGRAAGRPDPGPPAGPAAGPLLGPREWDWIDALARRVRGR